MTLLWSGAPRTWTWRCPICGGMSGGGLTEAQAEAGLEAHVERCEKIAHTRDFPLRNRT